MTRKPQAATRWLLLLALLACSGGSAGAQDETTAADDGEPSRLILPSEIVAMPSAAQIAAAGQALRNSTGRTRIEAVCTLLDHWSHPGKTAENSDLVSQTRPLRLTMTYREVAAQFGGPAVRRPGTLLYTLAQTGGATYRLVFLGSEFHYHTAIYEVHLDTPPQADADLRPPPKPTPVPSPTATPAGGRRGIPGADPRATPRAAPDRR